MTESVNFPTVQSFKYFGSTIYRGGSQQRRGEQSSKGMVEMERTEWRYLRQENANEIEAPDIPDSDSADVAILLRNMAHIS